MADRMKNHFPEFGAGVKVGADEVDFYHTVPIMFPSIDGTAIGTAKGTPPTAYTIVANAGVIDYPRNLVMKINNTSGSTNGGTATINGKDQFGNAISESFAVAAAANGGTVVGTKVFAQFLSGTVTFGGAGDAANGCTANIGFGTAGTTTLFGLPFKIKGTGDLLNYSWASAGASQFVSSASLGSYVSTAQHALLARTDFVGTSGGVALFKSTYDQTNDTDKGVVGR